MDTYYGYNVDSTQSVSETLTITNGMIQLRHIPRQSSVIIPGFIETTALVVPAGRFRVDYFDANGEYRECSRRIYFNAADNGKSVSVGYSAVGTPVTAADMNEIKNHMANTSIHGGGSSGGVNYLGRKGSAPSGANKGDLYFNYYDNTLYIYDSKWYPVYKYSPTFYRHVITLHGPNAMSSDIINTTAVPIYPDWHWHYAGSGCSEISLPLNITDPSQILGVYNEAGEEIPISNMYAAYDDPVYYDEDGCHRYYEFTGPDFGGQYAIYFSDWMAMKRLGYKENVNESATIVIYYEA